MIVIHCTGLTKTIYVKLEYNAPDQSINYPINDFLTPVLG